MLPLIFIFITNTIQVLMPGGPKLTPTDPEKKMVMEKWVNQGAMMMRLSTVITTVGIFNVSSSLPRSLSSSNSLSS